MNLSTLTKREKVMATVIVVALVVLVNLFLLQFLVGTHSQLTSDFARKRFQLKNMQALQANTGLWEQREAWVRAKQPHLENEATAGERFLSQVRDAAKKNVVLVEQPVIGNLERRPQYTAVTVSVDTKSSWKALIGFLANLQGPDQFVVLDNANLRTDSQDPTQMHGHFRLAKWFSSR